MSVDSKNSKNTWVYGVVPTGASLHEVERRGDHLPEVWVVESGDLAAIAGEAPEEGAKGTRNQALAHARVLEAAIVDAPVVPFRFGIMVPGDQEVGTDLLEARHDELAGLLKKVESWVQMTLKANYDEDAALREILEAEPEAQKLRESMTEGDEDATRNVRVRLGELISKALEQRRERDSAEILERLKPDSIAAAVEPLEKEFMVMNVPFLVERDRQKEFEDAVGEVAKEWQGHIHFRLLGPMPAYNFLEVEEPAWA
jgi:Gas vesicle synthesis protein GvpL/GvpF